MYILLEKLLKEDVLTRLPLYWDDFKSTAFAIFNEKDVILFNHPKCNGEPYMKLAKDEQFHGCTLILYEDIPTAIVDTTLYEDYNELYSLIAHELFHGHQFLNNETRFPDEMNGLKYPIDLINVQLRILERQTLYKAIVENYSNTEQFINQFISIREARMKHISKYVEYECWIETIEGPAHYIEFKALEDIKKDSENSLLKFSNMLLDEVSSHVDIRRSCYSSGLFICILLDSICDNWQKSFMESPLSLYDFFKKQIGKYEIIQIQEPNNSQQVAQLIDYVHKQKRLAFEKFNKTDGIKLLISGPFKVSGFDPMNITLIDQQAIHHRFATVTIKNKEYTIHKPISTTFKKDFTEIETLQIHINYEPAQKGDEWVIDGIGNISGELIKKDKCYYLYVN